MDYRLCHVGDVRQYVLEPGDQVVPSARLHVPRIDLPRDTEETHLHGDIEGSPYSRTPGKMSLAEAAATSAKAATPSSEEDRVRSQPARAPKKD